MPGALPAIVGSPPKTRLSSLPPEPWPATQLSPSWALRTCWEPEDAHWLGTCGGGLRAGPWLTGPEGPLR